MTLCGDALTVEQIDKQVIKAFILFFLLVPFCLSAEISEVGYKKCSFIDRYYMKSFFSKALKEEQAGHVLYFKTKPACIIVIILESRGKTIRKEQRALKGWQAFKKNEAYLAHPNFIISEYLFQPADDLKVLHIHLINKESLKLCILEHHVHFEEILGPNFNYDVFISKLEKGTPLPNLLKQDELLMGLVLGFGYESSKKYKEKLAISEDYQGINFQTPENCVIVPIAFVGNPHSQEVQQLVSTYEKELGEIWEMHKTTKKPLKTVLERLCNNTEVRLIELSRSPICQL